MIGFSSQQFFWNWREHPQHPFSPLEIVISKKRRYPFIIQSSWRSDHVGIETTSSWLGILKFSGTPSRCPGSEHRNGIDLYYAHVQLLSERDLQRPCFAVNKWGSWGSQPPVFQGDFCKHGDVRILMDMIYLNHTDPYLTTTRHWDPRSMRKSTKLQRCGGIDLWNDSGIFSQNRLEDHPLFIDS